MSEKTEFIPQFSTIEKTSKDIESVTTSASLMTDEEIKTLSDSLKDEKSNEILKAAKEETENTEYTELEYIDVPALTEVDTTAGETEKNYKDVFSDYNLSEEDGNVLFDLISKFKAGIKMNYYESLPKSFKDIADGIRALGVKNGVSAVSKNESAKILLAELIRDAQLNRALDEFNEEMNSAISEMNSEYNKIFTDAFEDVFARIDEIETSDPEQAAKIKEVKAAFDDATNLTRLKDFIASTNPKKLDKWTNRYKDEVNYFNTKVNTTKVKIPDIGELGPIIALVCPDLDLIDIKKFVVAICRHAYTLDVENSIGDLAYIYKLVSSIYSYKFLNKTDDEVGSLLFRNITEVIKGISSAK